MVTKNYNDLPLRFFLVFIAGCLLALVYIFQQINVAEWVGIDKIKNAYLAFSINKSIRLVINDVSCILIIHAIFRNEKFNKLALLVFCLELFLLLPIYLVVKLKLEGTSEISSPILAQIHRLIVNPMLMLLLMAAFYYQNKIASLRG
jgi:exosortase F-associated protein